MNQRFSAGLALALSLFGPTICAAAGKQTDRIEMEVGALHVERQGTGPGVILIPGLSSGSWVWRGTAPRLAKQHTIYLVTLPGFDGRPAVVGATLVSLRSDLAALIESQKLEKPVLVGHSLGGALSLAFAAEHSALIRGVVTVDGLPVFPGTENATERKPLADGVRAQLGGQTREQFEAGQQMYMRQIGTLNESTADEIARLTARSDIGAVADFGAQLMAQDLRPGLARIGVPVVAISPFHAPDMARFGIDEAGKTGYYRALLSGVKDLDVVSIGPARHFVMFDQPEKFAVALDAALAKMFESEAGTPAK
jgi:pimeloyl-ACP methyl ester carboxylesterase